MAMKKKSERRPDVIHWTEAAEVWAVGTRQAVIKRGETSGLFFVYKGILFHAAGEKENKPVTLEELTAMRFAPVGPPRKIKTKASEVFDLGSTEAALVLSKEGAFRRRAVKK